MEIQLSVHVVGSESETLERDKKNWILKNVHLVRGFIKLKKIKKSEKN